LAVFVLIIPGAVPGQEEKPPKPDPKKVAKEIDGILYSDLDKDKMLAKLKPYVAVMDSEADFKKKTGLGLGFGFGSGPPPVMHYNLLDCGLQLVIDPTRESGLSVAPRRRSGKKSILRCRYRRTASRGKGTLAPTANDQPRARRPNRAAHGGRDFGLGKLIVAQRGRR
jgi:hypothetical protein